MIFLLRKRISIRVLRSGDTLTEVGVITNFDISYKIRFLIMIDIATYMNKLRR